MYLENYIITLNLGFDFKGTNIVNEYMDETVRFRVTPKDYYGDAYIEFLHELCRELMTDLNEIHNLHDVMSLDEYYCKHSDILSPYEKKVINELLELF